MKRAILLLVAVCICSPSLFASDYLLGTWQLSSFGGSSYIAATEEPMFFKIRRGPVTFASISWMISENDIGNTLFADAESDPGFDNVVSYLTNGQEEFMTIFFLYGGSGIRESEFTDVIGIPQIDFQGYNITRIGLTLNDLFLSTPGQNPNDDGVWTDYSYDASISFYVPEPATLLLLSLGGLILRKKK